MARVPQNGHLALLLWILFLHLWHVFCVTLTSRESSVVRAKSYHWGAGYDILKVQELPGHMDMRTKMIYARVLNRSSRAVVSLRMQTR